MDGGPGVSVDNGEGTKTAGTDMAHGATSSAKKMLHFLRFVGMKFVVDRTEISYTNQKITHF